mgnify:CR=1 FL=1
MTVVNTNVAALAAQSSMMKNTKEMEDAMAKLSSGLRINTASDDAAGLSIADRLDSQVRGLSQAIRNAEDGQNLINTIEGASGEAVAILQRLRELAVQSATATNSGIDRGFINKEAQQLIGEMDRIASNTEWNGMTVLDGSFVNKKIQTGANASQDIVLGINDMKSTAIGNHVIRGTAANSTAATEAASNGLTGGDVVIAGFAGSKTITTVANDSAKEFRDDVNNVSDITGVTAVSASHALIKTLSAAGTITLNIGKNGSVGTGTLSAVTVNATIANNSDLTALRDAINNESGSTGVTASFYEGKINEILLTDADGDDIVLGDFTHTTASSTITAQAMDFYGVSTSAASAITLTDGGADSTTIRGMVILSSSESFGTTEHITADFFGATTEASSSLEKLGDIDLGSESNSKKAIATIDAAIDMVNNQRSKLGAISNRLDNVVNNLTNVVENTQESQSHIRDANFAQETSKLTKAQILNQAATSMLAQANASKQTVLALLQN